jgi:putative aldouronate transport system permease protein
MKEIKKKKGKRRWTRDDTDLTLISLPTFIWFVLFSYLPMFGIIIAFKDYKLSPGHGFIYNLLHSDWVGWSNFTYFFKSNAFWMLLRNTIVYNLVFIALGAAVAVGFALMLSNLRNKLASKAYQTMMFFPYFMSWVVISYIVYAVLTPEKGYLNNIIVALGGTKIMWYQEPKYWPFILVFVSAWKSVGYNCIVYLATLMGFDKSFYESAKIDGATRWQQIKYITLPLLRPTIIMLTMMAIGRIFYSDFGLFYQVPMNQGALYSTTNTIDTYVYRGLLQMGNVSMSAAAGVYQSIVGFILVLGANLLVRKIDRDSALI